MILYICDYRFDYNSAFLSIFLLQVCMLPRQIRTLCPSIPPHALREAQSLFVQECIKSYISDWHVVNYKYEDYSSDFRQLPNKVSRPDNLAQHVFEVDEDVDKDEDTASLGSQKGGLIKQGWLHKGNMNSAISVTMRSFKRRYFHLTQLGDGSYNLNFYKDEKINKEPKGTIFLDSCMGVVQNNRVRRFAFELKMQDKSGYVLAADSESEMDDWINTLNKILNSSFELAMQDKRNGDSHDVNDTESKNIESKMRNEARLKLFTLDPDLQKLDFSGIEPDVKPFEEKFGKRILVNCNDLSFNLQSCVAENEEGPTTNVEPFFISLSLFDIQSGRKISSDFHVDMNHPSVKALLPSSGAHNSTAAPDSPQAAQPTGVFSVTCPHPDVFLVARIEKVLQGGIAHCAEPYMKNSDSEVIVSQLRCMASRSYHFFYNISFKTFFFNSSKNPEKMYHSFYKNIKQHNCFHDAVAVCSLFCQCIYGRPGGPLFCKKAFAAVLHHQQNPEFYEEFKIELPAQLTDRHHLLFTLYHISCDSNSKASTKRREQVETQVGYAWLPLLKDGRVIMNEQQVAVAANLPSGYLSFQDNSSKQHTGQEVKWVDGGRPLLKVSTQLVSTVYTQDQHLHNFFHHCQSIESTGQSGGELIKYLKSLHAMEAHVMVKFLPTILNQLFRVLTISGQDDVAVNVTRVMIHVVAQCHEEGLEHHLRSYVKYVLKEETNLTNGKTVHEELAKTMTTILKPSTDFLTSNKLLKYSWYFFEVLVKSMAQYLIETGKAKVSRNQRFSASFYHSVETLVTMLMPHIAQKYKDNLDATRNANHSLAVFIKRCFTFMDRGFVFKQINNYINCFMPGDTKVLYEFKFEFLKVACNHEHYVPLNLPMPFRKGRIQRFQDLQLDYSLTDDFCKNHFLVGLLLREVGGGLQEFRDIRQIAVQVLKNLMIKHAFDDRYSSKGQQARLATLYLPLFSLLLENVHRLNIKEPSPVNNHTNVVRLTPSVLDSSLHKEVLGVISGTVSPHTPTMSSVRHTNSRSSLISTDSGNGLSERSIDKPHPLDKCHVAGVLGSSLLRCDKLDQSEVKNILMCFLHVLKSMSEDALFNYWNKASPTDLMNFFSLVCLHQFRYMGKRHIARTLEGSGPVVHERRSQTLPVSRSRTGALHMRLQQLNSLDNSYTYNHTYSHSDADVLNQSLLEGNIATEVCLTVLDTLSIFIIAFKTPLSLDHGHNPLMKKVFQVHLCFLQINQSETALKQVFTSLRTFIYKFPCTFFEGRADMCASFCYEILKCCNSKLSSIRSDAARLLYFLMKSNFDYTGRKSFIRTHLQVVIGVSQLIADVIGIGGTRFQQSLSIINNCANSDKTIKNTAFPSDVKDLTKKIRTVLMATAQMKEHERDPEMLVDLQYSLAKSYASTPELRKTWLDSMARIHVKNGDLSEAAMCYVHVGALVAEYLRRKVVMLQETMSVAPNVNCNGCLCVCAGMFKQGCTAFRVVTPNIDEEASMMEDVGMQDVHFNEDVLMELLEECADGLWKAERYELISDIYKLIIPIYEKRRDFERLAHLYGTLHRAYSKVTEVMHTGKRLLGTYFRVAFFGQGFFEDEDGKEYIYKEPKFTPLSEISQRLLKLYSDKFGAENVKMIQDSGKINPKDLDSKYAYIQVTHVTPFLEEKELVERKNDFERSHNIRRFVFEMPFTVSGKKQGGIEEQCKRRTILTTTHCFPYVKKRIAVMYQHHVDLNPIEVAIDEMSKKVLEIRQLCSCSDVDMIQLQLKLQGSISVQVNAGPLAYARAFLDDASTKKYPDNKVKQLKEVFRQFVEACGLGLGVNERLIKEDQQEYHDEMKANYRDLTKELSAIMHEPVRHTNTLILNF
uniref:Dedicator of cytokinesis 9 n=1 Tax=Sinocyclocheilus grahami TaxID=75366 RepID=A0A672RFB0_SINGR